MDNKVHRKGATKNCVYGKCKSCTRSEKAVNYRFFGFPKPCYNVRRDTFKANDHHMASCEMCKKCSRWIKLCNQFRDNNRFRSIEQVTKDKYICSKHFVEGELASLFPDPLPESEVKLINERSKSMEKSKKPKEEILEETSSETQDHDSFPSDEDEKPTVSQALSSVYCQPCVTPGIFDDGNNMSSSGSETFMLVPNHKHKNSSTQTTFIWHEVEEMKRERLVYKEEIKRLKAQVKRLEKEKSGRKLGVGKRPHTIYR